MRVHDSAVMPMSGMRVGGDARTVSPRMWAEASDTMWSPRRDALSVLRIFPDEELSVLRIFPDEKLSVLRIFPDEKLSVLRMRGSRVDVSPQVYLRPRQRH